VCVCVSVCLCGACRPGLSLCETDTFDVNFSFTALLAQLSVHPELVCSEPAALSKCFRDKVSGSCYSVTAESHVPLKMFLCQLHMAFNSMSTSSKIGINLIILIHKTLGGLISSISQQHLGDVLYSGHIILISYFINTQKETSVRADSDQSVLAREGFKSQYDVSQKIFK